MKVGRFVVPPGHPCLPGHFPGRPVVPAVLLLDEALHLLAPHLPGAAAGLDGAKFLRPVLPGETVDVSVDPAAGAFECTCAGHVVLRGRASPVRP